MMMQEIPCLKVEDKYAQMIVDNIKDWELRRTRTNYRGPLAIGTTKTKTVIGYVNLYNCLRYPTKALASELFERRHHASKFVTEYAKGLEDLWVYCLEKAKREPMPYPYSFSTGSWCKATLPRRIEDCLAEASTLGVLMK